MNIIGEWSPRAQVFLDELISLCSRHGVFLTTDYSTIEVRSVGDPEMRVAIEDLTQINPQPIVKKRVEGGPWWR